MVVRQLCVCSLCPNFDVRRYYTRLGSFFDLGSGAAGTFGG